MADELRVINTEEERRKRRRRKKKKESLPFGCQSRFTVAIVFCILLCAAAFAAAKWEVIAPDSLSKRSSFADSKKEEAFADITGSTVLEENFQIIDTGLAYISDTSIVTLNHDCSRIFSEKHSFTSPMMKSKGSYSIAFCEGGNEFRILLDNHKIYEGTQGNAITDCEVADNGTYCILSDQTGYLSCLSVYDKTNKFLYSYSFSDFYAVSVSANSDGSRIAVGAINSYNGRLLTKVYLLDITKSEPIKVFTYEDQLLYEVRFVSDDTFAVVTDFLTTVIKSDGSNEIAYSYSSQVLTAYDSCYNDNIVLSLSKSDDGRSCKIVTLSCDGDEISSFQTDLKVTALEPLDDRIAILSYGRLDIYSLFGELLGEWEIGSDAKNVLLPQNKTAYILGVSGITKMSLKY